MPRKTRGESGVAQRSKGIPKQHTVKRTRKHRKRESKRKGCQENIQDSKRGVARHRNRESRYA